MHVVLVNPAIPQNTGSIARTCAATKTPLHIVGKPMFEISEKRVRRAGLDYWPYVELYQHADWEAFIAHANPGSIWLFTKFAQQPYTNAGFQLNCALVFGCETSGLPPEIVERYPESARLRIPMSCPEVRSLNLSNAVAVGIYEARRQMGLDKVFA